MRSTLCRRKFLVSIWLEFQPLWADIGILPYFKKFSSCVKDDLILLIEGMAYFSWRISSLNFVAGSDLEIENFWPDWVLWKIIKNQFLLIFNLSSDLWTGSIRDQYSKIDRFETEYGKLAPRHFYMLNIILCEAHGFQLNIYTNQSCSPGNPATFCVIQWSFDA